MSLLLYYGEVNLRKRSLAAFFISITLLCPHTKAIFIGEKMTSGNIFGVGVY